MEPKELVPLVKRVIALVEQGPCVEACARSKSGTIVLYDSRRAATFSLYGAAHRVIDDTKKGPREHAALVRGLVGFGSIVELNDAAESHEAVLKHCREALTELERMKSPPNSRPQNEAAE